jgi:hypothetical protein
MPKSHHARIYSGFHTTPKDPPTCDEAKAMGYTGSCLDCPINPCFEDLRKERPDKENK